MVSNVTCSNSPTRLMRDHGALGPPMSRQITDLEQEAATLTIPPQVDNIQLAHLACVRA